MQIKTTKEHDFTPAMMAIIKKWEILGVDYVAMWGNWKPRALLVGRHNSTATVRKRFGSSSKC